jgi:tetratricopeptide (TPR) repeat protein
MRESGRFPLPCRIVRCLPCTIGLAALLASCATSPNTAKTPMVHEGPVNNSNAEVYANSAQEPTARELSPTRLCRIVADVDDAAARNALGVLRLRYDAEADDRASEFGSMLSRAKNEERFRVFHEDEMTRPLSVVGVLGTCIVYSDWKMPGQRGTSCRKASDRLAALGGDQALLRYADALLQWRQGDAKGALSTVSEALTTSPNCEALLFLRARVTAAAGADVTAQRQAWAGAEAGVPGCFTCAIETGKLVEQAEGKAAAAAAWERALKVAPDHAETLRRLAAAVAGIDDARALNAYAAAVDAGARDFATLLAAAKLAAQLAKTPAENERALGFARRAVDLGRSDPDARRLMVDLALRTGDLATASTAARALLELAPDDVLAHGALARAAMKAEEFSEASLHYEAVARSVAAGHTAGLDAALLTALTAERRALLDMLGVSHSTRAEGTPATVVQNTQRVLKKLWQKRVTQSTTAVSGVITVTIETDASGNVINVIIKNDTLNDKLLTAAAIASLRRSTIRGGAKRYTLDFTLE